MNVTINTDASFYHSTKAAYGIWISSDKGRIKVSAPFKTEIADSVDAEFKCLLNALYLLKSKNWETTTLFVNTDCQAVINKIKKGKKKKITDDNTKEFFSLIDEMKIKKFIVRHVKGHSNKKGKRDWVNRWCDTHAKNHAKKRDMPNK